ncbi:MAG TPA: alkaline phosphatase, partial [Candidatus Synoicihabitans sp.]|nr:alkaline phosphatase [Candidatus Synoicihabitans sp.]
MTTRKSLARSARWSGYTGLVLIAATAAWGAPRVSRLTPPSGLFSYGDASPPYIARFLPGQRFDLQATVQPDEGKTITQVEFSVDGASSGGTVTLAPATAGGLRAGSVVATRRAYSATAIGERRLHVRVTQSDGSTTTAEGNFEIVALPAGLGGPQARNVILMIGDGLGLGHRSAARIMLNGVSQGKALAPLAMDEMPVTGLVRTASLNSIVTDSAPGASCYATGNKADNNQEGVFPDDTVDSFDNPRVENIGEYLARTQNKWLGIVTTADVTDATPGSFGAHTSDRGAGTGIADQFLDEAVPRANLRVLLGGGRSWFLPSSTPGSSRNSSGDYELPSELANAWNVLRGARDPARDLLKDFQAAGFAYVSDRTKLAAVPANTARLLGLFQLGHLNAALDRIDKRRGRSTVVDDYGFPNQPLLEEMLGAALDVLQQAPAGFVLMVEGGGIDKQAHAMDTERWLLETIEFDRAVRRATSFAQTKGKTLVVVTADHETGGANIIGGSMVSHHALAKAAASGGGAAALREPVVGVYTDAGFPHYTIAADGFPETTNVDRRLLVGYAANADRHEDWVTNAKPLGAPGGVGNPRERDQIGGFLITGQVPGSAAVHTATDVPLTAAGEGAELFVGVMDNTDVFFRMMQVLSTGGQASASSSAMGGSPVLVGGSGQRTASDRLINLSTRGHVGTGAGVMIAGFVLEGTSPHRLLIRGVGPGLTRLGVPDALVDPALRVLNNNGAEVAANDNWEEAGAATITSANTLGGAFQLAAGSK